MMWICIKIYLNKYVSHGSVAIWAFLSKTVDGSLEVDLFDGADVRHAAQSFRVVVAVTLKPAPLVWGERH